MRPSTQNIHVAYTTVKKLATDLSKYGTALAYFYSYIMIITSFEDAIATASGTKLRIG